MFGWSSLAKFEIWQRFCQQSKRVQLKREIKWEEPEWEERGYSLTNMIYIIDMISCETLCGFKRLSQSKKVPDESTHKAWRLKNLRYLIVRSVSQKADFISQKSSLEEIQTFFRSFVTPKYDFQTSLRHAVLNMSQSCRSFWWPQQNILMYSRV